MTKFTVEQVNRIRCSIVNYRWVNTPPVAAFTVTTAMLNATFTNASTDAQTQPAALKYKWTFGDGATATTQNAMHTYASAGTYSVTLEVLDPGSGTSTTTQMVTVSGASTPPDAGVMPGTDAGVTPGTDAAVNNGDANMGSNGETGGNEAGGCCETGSSGSAALLCGFPVLLIVLRRRRR